MNCGKVDLVKSEMERIEVNLGIRTFSGNETKRQHGLAIIFDKSIHKAILGYNSISDWLKTILRKQRILHMALCLQEFSDGY